MKILSKFIYSNILGWKLLGNTSFSTGVIKKCVLIAVPHTSWQDFIIGILLRSVSGLKTNFIAKKELFVFPFGSILKCLGGVPIDRFTKENKVDLIASKFKEKQEFRIALSPEGTRKKVVKWKTGFYHIARKANIPIIMVTFDYTNKINKVSKPFYTTENIEKDFLFMESFFKGVEGKEKKYSYKL